MVRRPNACSGPLVMRLNAVAGCCWRNPSMRCCSSSKMSPSIFRQKLSSRAFGQKLSSRVLRQKPRSRAWNSNPFTSERPILCAAPIFRIFGKSYTAGSSGKSRAAEADSRAFIDNLLVAGPGVRTRLRLSFRSNAQLQCAAPISCSSVQLQCPHAPAQ